MSYDLVGIGVGPFNLSLATLLENDQKIRAKFIEKKAQFSWHSEVMFKDSTMQTSFLKDLVTPLDPTNRNTFTNYLVSKGMFYHLMNSSRTSVTRYEYEDYLKWAAENLKEMIEYSTEVRNISFNSKKKSFLINTNQENIEARNICLGAGPVKNIPKEALGLVGESLFHAKSEQMFKLDLTGKRVLIIGAGQTGVEIFKNSLEGKWGRPSNVVMTTGRNTLMPLDEGAFTNEYFTPGFVSEFVEANQKNKDILVKDQLLTSDGNTPTYLESLYEDLYLDKFYLKKYPNFTIAPKRWLKEINKTTEGIYDVTFDNLLFEKEESTKADIIILATGFRTVLPPFAQELREHLEFDDKGRPLLKKDYSLKTDFPEGNKIFAMNMSRHFHGIADPQTSLMAWRSGVIYNSLTSTERFKVKPQERNFCTYDSLS